MSVLMRLRFSARSWMNPGRVKVTLIFLLSLRCFGSKLGQYWQSDRYVERLDDVASFRLKCGWTPLGLTARWPFWWGCAVSAQIWVNTDTVIVTLSVLTRLRFSARNCINPGRDYVLLIFLMRFRCFGSNLCQYWQGDCHVERLDEVVNFWLEPGWTPVGFTSLWYFWWSCVASAQIVVITGTENVTLSVLMRLRFSAQNWMNPGRGNVLLI